MPANVGLCPQKGLPFSFVFIENESSLYHIKISTIFNSFCHGLCNTKVLMKDQGETYYFCQNQSQMTTKMLQGNKRIGDELCSLNTHMFLNTRGKKENYIYCFILHTTELLFSLLLLKSTDVIQPGPQQMVQRTIFRKISFFLVTFG